MPFQQFISQSKPIQLPFSIVWAISSAPARVIHEVHSGNDLHEFNSALNEDVPFRWHPSRSSYNRPHYLFGDYLWEIKPSEMSATQRELRLLFLEASRKERVKYERLKHSPQLSRSVPPGSRSPNTFRFSFGEEMKESA